MKTILAMLVLTCVWYTAALRAENQVQPDQIEKSETGAAAASPSPGAPAAGTGPRMLTDENRNDLIAALSAASGNKVWFVTQANDPEAYSFQREIEDAFVQAGWEVAASSESTYPLRAGLRVFAAGDVFPDHVSVAVLGLRGIGFDVFAGSGYRAFYDKRKEKNPDFSGVELAPDQDFVIVVGPKPPAPVAAAASPSSVPSPAVPAAGTDPRMLTDEARNDLIAALSEAPGKQVWFVTQANDPEADSFQREIEDAFVQAGWEVAASSESTRPLRSGLRIFAAAAELPDHVSVAVVGLRDTGFDVFAGTGYRAFYDKQKEQNPDFSGVELAPDQDFVIVVGPNPPAPEAAAASPSPVPSPDPSPAAPAAGASPRMLTNETLDVLIAALSEAPGKQVWFVTQANDPEADSFQFEIEDAFLQAGWKVAASSQSTRPLRAGLRVFAADAELPDHVSVAVAGLRDTGFDVFVGTGYRAFYDKQKEKNPDFSGIELAPDQDFVIVVGPNPPAL